MNADTILAATPDSAAGRELRWYFRLLLSLGEGASVSGSRSHYTEDVARRARIGATDEEERAGWRGFADRLGAIADFVVIAASDFQIEAAITAAKDREWRVATAMRRE